MLWGDSLLASASSEPIGYISYGRFVELVPDESELSVRTQTESPREIEEELSKLGFPEFRYGSALRNDQFLFVRGDASGSPEVTTSTAIVEVVAALAKAVDGFVSPVFDRVGSSRVVVRPELYVRFAQGGPTEEEIDAILAPHGTILEREWANWKRSYRVALSTHSALEALAVGNTLAARDDVLWARASRSTFGPGPSGSFPDDPYFQSGLTWWLDHPGTAPWEPLSDLDVNAPEVWDGPPGQIGHGCVVVLLMDNGIQKEHINTPTGCGQSDHPDLGSGQVGLAGHFTDQTPDCGGAATNSCDNHGTWIAGVVAATMDNAEGITGIAPGVTFKSAKVFGDSNPGNGCVDYEYNPDWLTAALGWSQTVVCAGGLQTRVVTTFSANPPAWQFPNETDEVMLLKYVETWNDGHVHFASAGNTGGSPVQVPGLFWIPGAPFDPLPGPNVVNAVSNLTYESTDSQPHLEADSSYGDGIDFTGPGTRIFTTDRTGSSGICSGAASMYCILGEQNYAYLTGTSYPTPLIAGVAALVLSENPTLSAQAVEFVLRTTADPLGTSGYSQQFGWGLPKADAAVALAADLLFFDGFETGDTSCWNGDGACSGGNF